MTICPACGIAIVGAPDPSPAELRVLNAIMDYHDRHGRFPTYREIRIGLSLSSTTAVYLKVHALAAKGFVTIEHRRGITAARRAV